MEGFKYEIPSVWTQYLYISPQIVQMVTERFLTADGHIRKQTALMWKIMPQI